jgi:hypothetical protein
LSQKKNINIKLRMLFAICFIILFNLIYLIEKQS